MATTTTDLKEAKRDECLRKVTGKAERAALLEGYSQSGLTQKAFAEREGIKYCTFTSWLQKRREEERLAVRPLKSERFAELVFPKSERERTVEVQLCDGTVIRGGSASEVAQVAQALRSEKRC